MYVKLNDKLIKRERTLEEINQEKEYLNSVAYKEEKIRVLKEKLQNTDYIACKLAEGTATKEEYANELLKRQEWRDEINKFEKEIEND